MAAAKKAPARKPRKKVVKPDVEFKQVLTFTENSNKFDVYKAEPFTLPDGNIEITLSRYDEEYCTDSYTFSIETLEELCRAAREIVK